MSYVIYLSTSAMSCTEQSHHRVFVIGMSSIYSILISLPLDDNRTRFDAQQVITNSVVIFNSLFCQPYVLYKNCKQFMDVIKISSTDSISIPSSHITEQI